LASTSFDRVMNRNCRNRIIWAACTKAGLAYAMIVFMPGFGLSTIRVLHVAPRVGQTLAADSQANCASRDSLTVA
jgi:hypothetical protein